MHEGAPGGTTFAPEHTNPFSNLPHDILDPLVAISPALRLTMDDVERAPDGRIGMRTDTPGQPALFRVGQQVHIDLGAEHGSEYHYYMDRNGNLQPFPADHTPEDVAQFRHALVQRERRVHAARDLNAHEAAEIGVEFAITAEAPMQNPQSRWRRLGNVIVGAWNTARQRAVGRHHPTQAHLRPVDNRPRNRRSGAHEATRPGRHRAR